MDAAINPTPPLTDAERFNRALAKARVLASGRAGLIAQQGNDDLYTVESSTYEGEIWTCTPRICNCPAFQVRPVHYQGRPVCKHTLAVRLKKGEKIIAMPTQPAKEASSATLDALHAVGAGIESLNQRVANVEDQLDALLDKFDKLLDLTASGLVHLGQQEPQAPQAASSTNPQKPPNPENIHFAPKPQSLTPQLKAPNTTVATATAILRGYDGVKNRPTFTVLCGQWQKFGVPAYPEYIQRLGFGSIDDVPEGQTPWDKDVIVELTANGGPRKVLGLAS